MGRSRNWSNDELDYLMDNWGTTSIETIAKKLGRSIKAIQLKAGREGLGPFLEAGNYITLNQLMNEIIGEYVGKQYTIKQWSEKGLPIKKRKVKDRSFNVINLDDWWKWAQKNSTLIDFSKLEPLALGKEPSWLKEKRRADIEKNMTFKKTPWTKVEDELLRQLLSYYKYTYRELSLRLQRTEGAIKRRMIDLDIKSRPIKMPNHNPWSEEETIKLIELYHKGHTPNTMANYIPRSSQAISGKIERLIKEGELKPRNQFRKSC